MKNQCILTNRSDSQGALHRRRGETQEEGCAHCRSPTLGQEVEDSLGQAELPAHNHCCCDGWVNVSAAYVAEALHHGGNAQSKGKRDLHQVGGLGILFNCPPVYGCTETQKDKKHHGEKLGSNAAPELLSPDAPEGGHNFFSSGARRKQKVTAS